MIANALILLLALATPPTDSVVSLARQVASFSELGPEDELRVHYFTGNCFSWSRHNLVFRGGAHPTVTVSFVSSFLSRYDHVDEPTRTAVLSDTILAGLDRLLHFYRTPHDNRCHAWEYVDLEQWHNDAVVAVESIRDGGCSWPRTPDIYSLGQLLARVKDGPGPGR